MKISNCFFIFLMSFFYFNLLAYPPVEYPVGELGAKWQFPSDHLPIGAKIGNFHMATWNVLDTKYLHHIVHNRQGLRESAIMTTNVLREHSTNELTIREEHVVQSILAMINHPTHPRALIALQEVSGTILEELYNVLPEKMNIVTTFPGDLANGDVLIYDSSYFEWGDLVSKRFQAQPKYTYSRLSLTEKTSNKLFHFINCHIPGGDVHFNNAFNELAQFLIDTLDTESNTLVIGDMNCTPPKFIEQLDSIHPFASTYHFRNLWVNYPTHIDTQRQATWIDSIVLFSPDMTLSVAISPGYNAFFPALDKTLDLVAYHRPFPYNLSFDLWCRLKGYKLALVENLPCMAVEEQLGVALQEYETEIFDLKLEFLNYYIASNQITDQSVIEELKKKYGKDASLNEALAEWVNKYHTTLAMTLRNSAAEVILLKNIDAHCSTQFHETEEETVLHLIEIAASVKESGKLIALPIKPTTAKEESVKNKLITNLLVYPDDIVKASYFTLNEEETILNQTVLTRSEKISFLAWAKGFPMAYVPIFEWINDYSSAEMYARFTENELRQMAENAIHIKFLQIESNQIQQKLTQLALEDREIKATETELIATGLVGWHEGKYILPPCVRDVLLGTGISKTFTFANESQVVAIQCNKKFD